MPLTKKQAILVLVGAPVIMGALTMGLWNTVMVKIFAVPTLTWIDGIFLWVLARTLLAGNVTYPRK